MTEHDQQADSSPEPEERTKGPTTGQAAEGYIGHVMGVLTRPDRFFDAGHRSGNTNAMIDLGAFLGVFFLATIVARTFGYTGFDFEFGHLLDGIKAVLVIGIPIGALVFAWNAMGKTRGLDFYMEKFGGALVLSTLLLLGAIVLDVLDIRIQSWFRGLAMVFVYIGVFAITYAHAVPGKLKSAVAFTAAFYILYRLLGLLF